MSSGKLFTFAACSALALLVAFDSESFAQRGGRGGGGRGGGGRSAGRAGSSRGGGGYHRGGGRRSGVNVYLGSPYGNRYGSYRRGYYAPGGYYYGPSGYLVDDGAVDVDGATVAQRRARVIVKGPENAEIWFNKVKASSEGAEHSFRTKPLVEGKTYKYTIRARWQTEDGEEMEKTKTINLRAGKKAVVNFDDES